MTYIITDWTVASLPGPNKVLAHATKPDQLSPKVDVETGYVYGPTRGIFHFNNEGNMYRLWDPIGNDISDGVYAAGSSGVIAAWPWGNVNWRGNKLVNPVAFPGGRAAVLAAANSGFVVRDSYLDEVTLDLTTLPSNGGIYSCDLRKTTVDTGGVANGTVNLVRTKAVESTITNSGARALGIYNSTLTYATVQLTGTGGLGIESCALTKSTVRSLGDENMVVNDCIVSGESTLSGEATGVWPASFEINRCVVSGGSLIQSGGTSCARKVNNCELNTAARLFVTQDGTSSPNSVAAARTLLTNEATLTVDPAGNVGDCRFCLANIQTGPFGHVSTIVDGYFVVLFTAVNNNRLKNKGFSDVI